MISLAYTLMIVAMLSALGIVLAGLVIMSRGGDVNKRWGNRLMRYRIYAQSFAIAMFALGYWLTKSAESAP